METNTPMKKKTVTFHVFRKDGSKNPDIKKYFLENLTLTAQDALEGKIKLQDGTLWDIVLESPVHSALRGADAVKCLVSFQARTYGNFAVFRLFDETKAKLKGEKNV